MGKVKFNPEIKKTIDSILLGNTSVVPGKMFGYPAYFTNKKLFACIYENGVGVKVPVEVANQLVGQQGIIHFQPMGRRKMKEWIQINRDVPEDYLKDRDIFEKSLSYVGSIRK